MQLAQWLTAKFLHINVPTVQADKLEATKWDVRHLTSEMSHQRKTGTLHNTELKPK